MKIAVIGTSNSIRPQGYEPLYQALEYPNIVDNLSIGGSNCQLIPFQIEKYDIFNNYDFLITDCSVNDNDYLILNLRTPDWLYNELYTIMSIIKEAPIKHLHLIFPYDDPDNTYRKIHIQVCEELEIPYLDIITLIKSCPQHTEHKIFSDVQHINTFYAQQLPYIIKEMRQNIFKNTTPKNLSKIYKNKKYCNINLEQAFKEQFEITKRGTSLCVENFISIKENEALLITDLPQFNLESLFFWTNKEAGYYQLSSKIGTYNYNLYYIEANYLYFRPIAQNNFLVQDFLKLQVNYNPHYPLKKEINFPPLDNVKTELLLNAFQISFKLNPPLTWKEKKITTSNILPIILYKKISHFIMHIEKLTKQKTFLPEDFIIIAANIYNKNPYIRKRFISILKTNNNPYYFYLFAKLYLIPKKKNILAKIFLEKALQLDSCTSVILLLIEQYIFLQEYGLALKLLSEKIAPTNIINYFYYLCLLYTKMKNKKYYFLYAEKLLQYSPNLKHFFFIIENCIELQEYQKAKEYLQLAFSDIRFFQNKNNQKRAQILAKQIQNNI